MRYLSAACVLTLLVGLWAVVPGRSAGESEPGWGDIKGQVVWGEAEIPARQPLDINQDQAHCLANGPILSEDWVINKENKGVRWVFVWLAPETPGSKAKLPINPDLAKVPTTPAVLDQPHCMFEPHAQGIRQGQELLAKNSASVTHNVDWKGNPLRNPGGNVLIPPGESYAIKNLKADRLPVKVTCDIHRWMKAWVGVYDHPYFAVTDADGKFEIKKAPAGNFRLVVWQESVGFRGGAAGRNGTPITIKAGGVTDLGTLDIKSKYE